MRIVKQRVVTFFLLSLIAILLLLVFTIPSHFKTASVMPVNPLITSNRLSRSDLQSFYSYWAKQIDTVGPHKAYKRYKASIQENADTHFFTHLFGELLYRKEGFNGITTCDKFNGFGCYHGFMSTALQAHGPSLTSKLSIFCKKSFGEYDSGCRHGIGHGLAEYYGSEHITQALDTCTKIEEPGILGCTQGVFMETNFPGMTLPLKSVSYARPPTEGEEYYPCDKVAKMYRQSCYFEIPEWWDTQLNKDYKKIILLCNDVADQKEKSACFLGLGRSAAEMNGFDIQEVKNVCNMLTTESRKLECRAGAFFVFQAVNKSTDAKLFCDYSDSDCRKALSQII